MPNYVIRKLKERPNGNFYIFWTDDERRSQRKTTGTSDKKAADAFFAKWLAIEEAGDDLAGEQTPINELFTRYQTKHVEAKRPSSVASVGYAWANLKKHFGELRAGDVNQDVVDDYTELRIAGDIGRVATGPGVRHELAILRAALNWNADLKRKHLDKSLLPAFDMPPPGDARDRWLRKEEIDRLLSAAVAERQKGRVSPGELFLRIALETGARRGAIIDLTWDRIDFETNVIHFNVPGRAITKKRRSNPPISASLRPVLMQADRERKEGKVVSLSEKVVKIDVRKALERFAKIAQVDGLSPHVLRHTAATHMARRGVSLFKIAKVLGNTIAMVEKVYSHHAPEDLRDAVDLISDYRDAAE